MDSADAPLTSTPGIAGEKQPLAARLAVSGLFFFNGVIFATWASRIPAVKGMRGLTDAELGLSLLAISSGAVLGLPLAGYLIARFGSDWVCKVSSLLCVLVLPAMVAAPNGFGFLAALFLFGSNHGVWDVAMNDQAVLVERRYRRPIMSSFHALWSSGALSGATLGGILTSSGLAPLTHLGLLAGLGGIGTVIFFPYLIPQEAPTPVERNAQDLPEKLSRVSWLSRPILTLGAVALCVMIGEGAMADWSGVYLKNVLRTSEGFAAAGYATFSVAMALGRFAGDRLTTRFTPVMLVRCSGLIAAVGLFCALVWEQPVIALIGFGCVGAGFATVVPTVFTAAGNTPGVVPGVALAAVSTIGYSGFLLGPPFIGLTAEWLGLRTALGIIVATSLLVAALATSVGRDRSQAK